MKSSLAFIYTPIVFIIIFGCTPKESSEKPAINYGDGFFYYKDKTIADDSAMRVFYYKPSNFNADRPIVFLMHGADRKVDHITEDAAKSVEKYNILLILPEYSEQLFPKVEAYQYGNVRTKPKELWTYYLNFARNSPFGANQLSIYPGSIVVLFYPIFYHEQVY